MSNLILKFKLIIATVSCTFIAACGGNGSSSIIKNPTPISHVKMHYDLLNNQAMILGEMGSLPPYMSITHFIKVTAFSKKGSTKLHIQDSSALLKNQLIVYLSNDGNYYVGQIKMINSLGIIELFKPLEGSINIGNNAWDFYGNASHANSFGFKAIADFAIKSLKLGTNTQGNHILLGDSWFEEGSLHNRLIQKLPSASIINQGVGGNTSHDLISRFDSDVTPYAPDYIWIISGTNDYWKGVSTNQYKTNLHILISKSKAIGAKIIIIDSSVGEGIGPSGVDNQFQSEKYVNVILELNQTK